MELNKIIEKAAARLSEQGRGFAGECGVAAYPNAEAVVGIIKKLRLVMFPGYFGVPQASQTDAWRKSLLADIYRELSREIKTAFAGRSDIPEPDARSMRVSGELLERLPEIQSLLHKDAQAGFEGDPAARSVDEVIVSYPGFYAILVYRAAHFLFEAGVPFIPRMMSEHAHSVTGIDIHPGARIGEYFFIDHGTGVVIGETALIGSRVKLYQGVTLGALSTKSGQKLAGVRRHPTLEDNVTVYSNASILGGETIIGKNSTVGGNVFIVKSVPENTTVKAVRTVSE